MTARGTWWIALGVCVACASEPIGVDGGSPIDAETGDADRTDAPMVCPEPCDDRLFCNGVERCEAGRCVEGSAPCTTACDETTDSCACPEPDADGDGHASIACGGDDCDDADRRRHPAAPEVCDGENVDEDCDPATFGVRDGDSDGYPDARCCNETTCGSDCDDASAAAHPTEAESCDGLDNDCDGEVDESVSVLLFRDADGDLHGASGESAVLCPDTPGWVPSGDDCDDASPIRYGGAAEECNAIRDEDCDSSTHPFDADDDGHERAGCAGADCDDTDASIRPGAPDPCDGVDSDCDGIVEDADRDGHVAIGAICTSGPLPADDCDDGDGARSPSRAEVCDGIDDDCDGAIDEEAEASPACALPSAISACRAAVCAIGACDDGFGDCDGIPSNGCEVDLRSSAAHCGSCALACGDAGTCSRGLCDFVSQVSTGVQHTCVLGSAGAIACFGNNFYGQLGDGTAVTRAAPTRVSGLGDAVEVAAGGYFTCARRASGSVACWGDNTVGQLGDGTTTRRSTPVAVRSLPDAVRMAAGLRHACAIRADGSVVCWGENARGQLGDGTFTERYVPGPVPGVSGAVGLALGYGHSCAVTATGTVFCWGRNDSGQIGDGTTSGRPTPVEVTGLTDAIGVAAGQSHTCALRSTGALVCWGANNLGQLGDGTTSAHATPGPVSSLADAVEIAAGSDLTCARRASGTVACWGLSSLGQAGRPSGTVLAPNPIATVAGASSIAASESHACAVSSLGRLWCWGSNARSQLGVPGFTGSTAIPLVVASVENDVEVALGQDFSCARRMSGGALCWGANGSGELGTTPSLSRTNPANVPGVSDAVSLSPGARHACALRADGSVLCWGANDQGQVGMGSFSPSPSTATAVIGLADSVEVSAGGLHSCARRADRSVVCWGDGREGQLGDGILFSRATPVVVAGLAPAAELATGTAHTCARLTDGRVACWGRNSSGQLGDGTTLARSRPVTVPGLEDAVGLTAGAGHTCARRSDGTIVCWGDNTLGQLGDGTTSSSLSPVAVLGLSGATRVAAGPVADDLAVPRAGRHTCALDDSGGGWCWGDNQSGEAGIASIEAALTSPASFSLLAGVPVSLDTGGLHTCASVRYGVALYCWGAGGRGQIGNGALSDVRAPVAVNNFPR